MAIKDKISALIIQNVEVADEVLESLIEDLIEKTAQVTTAALVFEGQAGNDEKAIQAGEGLVTLAAEFGTAFPDLTTEQAERVKAAVDVVFQGATPEQDAAGTTLFNTAVDTVLAAQELNDYFVAQGGEPDPE